MLVYDSYFIKKTKPKTYYSKIIPDLTIYKDGEKI